MKNIKLWILCVTAGLFLGGCATHREPIASTGEVSVEIISAKASAPLEARAYKEGNNLVISGQIRELNQFLVPGHVDMDIYGPDGNLWGHLESKVRHSGFRRGGMVKTAKFKTTVKQSPPQGARIVLKYHASAAGHEGGETDPNSIPCQDEGHLYEGR